MLSTTPSLVLEPFFFFSLPDRFLEFAQDDIGRLGIRDVIFHAFLYMQ